MNWRNMAHWVTFNADNIHMEHFNTVKWRNLRGKHEHIKIYILYRNIITLV